MADILICRGVPMAVVTSLSECDAAMRLALFGLGNYFDVVIADKGGLAAYLTCTGADPRGVLCVGTPAYAELAASMAGMAFAMATWFRHDLPEEGSLVLAQPSDLLRAVQTLDGPSHAALGLRPAA